MTSLDPWNALGTISFYWRIKNSIPGLFALCMSSITVILEIRVNPPKQ